MKKILDLYRNAFSGLSRDILLLALVTLINKSGTMILPFLTIYLTYEKGFTLKQAGIVMTMFGIGSLVGNYLGGIFTDKFGAYKVQLWTLIFSGFGFISLIYFESFLGFSFGVFVVNAISEAFRPANLASINVYSKPENRVRSVSLIRFAVNLGFAVGPAMGGILIGLLGYDWLFIVDGLTCIIAAFAFWYLIEDKTTDEAKSQKKEDKVPFYKIFKDRPFVYLLIFQLFGAISFFQLFTTFPIYVKEVLGKSEAFIGLLMAINGLFIAIVEMPMIYLIENKYKRIVLIALGNILMGFAWFLFNVSSWIYLPFLVIIMISIGEIIDFPFKFSLSVSLADEKNQGVYMGWYTMVFSIAFIIAPSLGTYIIEYYGFYYLWNISLLFNLIAGVGIYFYFINRDNESLDES